MRYETGQTIDMDLTICSELQNGEQVWVILKEDLALMEDDNKGSNTYH